MTIEQLTSALGWCTLINYLILCVSSAFLAFSRDWMMEMHSKWFGVSKDALPGIYFKYLAYFKIAIIVFNLTPYIALLIVV